MLSGSNGRSLAMSAADAIGFSMTGPTPGLMSKSTPSPVNGVVMSAKRIAASTPRRRTGWSVTSAQSAGSRVISMSDAGSRMARNSGSDAAGLAHEPDGRGVDRLAPAARR